MRISISNQQGSITVTSLIILFVTMMLMVALSSETVTRCAATHRNVSREQALCIAEAGLDYGVNMLKANPNYTGTNGSVTYGQGGFRLTTAANGGSVVLTSVGTLSDGISATAKVTVNNSGHMVFPNGCMVARDDIDISGSASTTTSPYGSHQASLMANGNITANGSFSVDGSVSAHGNVDVRGSGFIYNTPAQNGAPLIQFPDAAATSAWQESLKTKAQAGGTRSGINLSGSNSLTIASPVYINGDIKLTGSTRLTITGTGPVFVNGKITTAGSSAIFSNVLLAASGTIDVSGSNSYTVTSATPNHVGLVSFATDPNGSQAAVTMTGSSNMSMGGLVYAANGSIKMTGSSAFYGALVAAGGDIRVTGSGNVVYPVDLLKNNDIIPGGFKVESWLEP